MVCTANVLFDSEQAAEFLSKGWVESDVMVADDFEENAIVGEDLGGV